MKPGNIFVLIAIILQPSAFLYAQQAVQVTKPELSLENNKIRVSYDLLNTSPEEKFAIRIEVTDSEGNLINASSLSGDVGEDIPGGRNKLIIWDIEADSIYLDDEIYVQVFAKAIPAQEESEPVAEETEPDAEPGSRTKTAPPSGTGKFSRTGVILQSLAFPGLGLSRMNRGKPHWIRGIVGYGCMAGSLYLNRKAVSNYDAYRNPANPDQVDKLFNRSLQQDNVSEILACAAAGVWITDMVWTFMGSSVLRQDQTFGSSDRFSVGATVEPVFHVPLFAFRIHF